MTPAVAVCGFPRCGSSMLMAMLDAGGIPPVEGSAERSYETSDLTEFSRMTPARLGGRAIKVLDTPLFDDEPWPDMEWRIVWMLRDHRQQARSAVKFFGEVLGLLPLTGSLESSFRDSYAVDEPRMGARLAAAGSVLSLRFEDVLAHPLESAQALGQFLRGFHFDAGAAAAVVHRRGPECLPHADFELTGRTP